MLMRIPGYLVQKRTLVVIRRSLYLMSAGAGEFLVPASCWKCQALPSIVLFDGL